MYKYQIIMYWSEPDNCYVTGVPELPGCMSDGETPEDAIKNTQLIIQVWLECAKEDGREIPEPVYNRSLVERA